MLPAFPFEPGFDPVFFDLDASGASPYKARRKRLARLLRPPKSKALREIASGIVLSEAMDRGGSPGFREACRTELRCPAANRGGDEIPCR